LKSKDPQCLNSNMLSAYCTNTLWKSPNVIKVISGYGHDHGNCSEISKLLPHTSCNFGRPTSSMCGQSPEQLHRGVRGYS